MKKHILQPLSETERKFAEENHNLVYSFLHRYNYSLEEYYNIVIFGYLKAVQVYYRREDIKGKFDFAFIAWQYMRAELGNHFRMENAKKRKQDGKLISLDAVYAEMETLHNTIGGKSAESSVMEKELLNDIMKNLSETQQEIAQLKITGYSNKEVYQVKGIKQSTYYKELKRIRNIVEEILIG